MFPVFHPPDANLPDMVCDKRRGHRDALRLPERVKLHGGQKIST